MTNIYKGPILKIVGKIILTATLLLMEYKEESGVKHDL